MCGQRHAPAPLSPGKNQVSFVQEDEWAGGVREISSLPGFDPRTVQSVASHYTDCAVNI